MGENVVESEVLQNEVEAGESTGEVGTVIDYTELLEQLLAEQQAQTESLVEIKESAAESYTQLQTHSGSLMVVVAFVVIGFCWDCMRTWRRELLKIGDK